MAVLQARRKVFAIGVAEEGVSGRGYPPQRASRPWIFLHYLPTEIWSGAILDVNTRHLGVAAYLAFLRAWLQLPFNYIMNIIT